MFAHHDYVHIFGSVLHGSELKHLTDKHAANLQKSIRECLPYDSIWTMGGLLDLCEILVYESITETLFGSNVDVRSIVKDLHILDKDIHILAYPSPFRWFRPDLIRARNKVVEYLSSIDSNADESAFITQLNSLTSRFSKKDVGSIKTAILWAAFGNVIPAVFWTYCYIDRYPIVRDAILREIKDNDSLAKDINLMNDMPNLDSTIEETMRLMANALVLRECTQDIEITIPGINYRITLMQNDIVILFPFVSQIDEQFFPKPHEFIYDRFLVDNQNHINPRARRVHAPFGEGKFICPGRYLGKSIVKLTLIALLKQFDIEFLNQCDKMKMPAMQKERHGFGVPPPVKDIPIRYRIK